MKLYSDKWQIDSAYRGNTFFSQARKLFRRRMNTKNSYSTCYNQKNNHVRSSSSYFSRKTNTFQTITRGKDRLQLLLQTTQVVGPFPQRSLHYGHLLLPRFPMMWCSLVLWSNFRMKVNAVVDLTFRFCYLPWSSHCEHWRNNILCPPLQNSDCNPFYACARMVPSSCGVACWEFIWTSGNNRPFRNSTGNWGEFKILTNR